MQARALKELGSLLDRAKNAQNIEKKAQSFESEQRRQVDFDDFGEESKLSQPEMMGYSSTDKSSTAYYASSDPRSKTLRAIMSKYADQTQAANPFNFLDQSLKADISKLEGIRISLTSRTSDIKNFVYKRDLKLQKEQKLVQNRSSSGQFELN